MCIWLEHLLGQSQRHLSRILMFIQCLIARMENEFVAISTQSCGTWSGSFVLLAQACKQQCQSWILLLKNTVVDRTVACETRHIFRHRKTWTCLQTSAVGRFFSSTVLIFHDDVSFCQGIFVHILESIFRSSSGRGPLAVWLKCNRETSLPTASVFSSEDLVVCLCVCGHVHCIFKTNCFWMGLKSRRV